MKTEATVTLAVLIFAAVVAMLPNSILFPAARDLAAHLHVPQTGIGYMVSVYSVSYVLATPLLGVWSDRAGRRVVLACGLTLFAVGGLFPVLTRSFAWILVGRVIMGVGSAGILPMVDSAIGDIYPAGAARRSALAAFSAALAIADALVPFMGGALAAWHWQAVFLSYGLGFLGALLTAWAPIPKLAAELRAASWRDYGVGLRLAARIPSLSAALASAALFGVVYFGFCALLPTALGGTDGSLHKGLLFFPVGALWLVTSAWLARRSRSVRTHTLVFAAGLLLGASTVWMACVHDFASLLIIGAIWGAGAAVMTTSYTWVIGDDTPDAVRGAMNAVYNAAYVLGFSLGAPLFMTLREWSGYSAAVVVLACLVLPLALIGYARIRLHRQEAEESGSRPFNSSNL